MEVTFSRIVKEKGENLGKGTLVSSDCWHG